MKKGMKRTMRIGLIRRNRTSMFERPIRSVLMVQTSEPTTLKNMSYLSISKSYEGEWGHFRKLKKSTFQCMKFHIFCISCARDIVSLVKTALEVQVCHVRNWYKSLFKTVSIYNVSWCMAYIVGKHIKLTFQRIPFLHHLDFSRWSYCQNTDSCSRRPTASRSHFRSLLMEAISHS